MFRQHSFITHEGHGCLACLEMMLDPELPSLPRGKTYYDAIVAEELEAFNKYADFIAFAATRNRLSYFEAQLMYCSQATKDLHDLILKKLKQGIRLFNTPAKSANQQIIDVEIDPYIPSSRLVSDDRKWQEHYEEGTIVIDLLYANKVPPSHMISYKAFFAGAPSSIKHSMRVLT